MVQHGPRDDTLQAARETVVHRSVGCLRIVADEPADEASTQWLDGVGDPGVGHVGVDPFEPSVGRGERRAEERIEEAVGPGAVGLEPQQERRPGQDARVLLAEGDRHPGVAVGERQIRQTIAIEGQRLDAEIERVEASNYMDALDRPGRLIVARRRR